jgi:hypothetical protein
MKRIHLGAALVLSASAALAQTAAAPAAAVAPAPVTAPAAFDARATIENFYRAYIPVANSEKKKPEPRFSKAFRALLTKDTKACKRHSNGDICGWSADGDPYLDAQEVDPKLTFENSKIAITETAPGTIDVKLNIFPNEVPSTKENEREIIFSMVQENGEWKVDDVRNEGESARKLMEDEIRMLNKGTAAK